MNYEKISSNYEDRYYYVAFNHFQKIGPINMARLEKFFPNVRQAFFAGTEELERAGLNPSLARDFTGWRKTPEADIENIINVLEKEQIKFITWHEPSYPALLKEIHTPPPLLYYKGSLDGQLKNRLAVVGSRRHSAYAAKIITELLPAVIDAGIEIISGLALGIDALAHQAALDSGGITLAVLGSGLDDHNIYPRANRQLAENIISNGGALLSEFPPGTPPYKQNFPQRNRIISGLAQATLIIEAKTKSGALITVNHALEQNREVLAVPGNIFSEFSAGPNELIKAGAKTVTKTEDILEVFKISADIKKDLPKKINAPYQPENAIEALIYDLIKQASARAEHITPDEIIKKSQLDTAIVNSTLSMLEIKGLAKSDGFSYDLN